MTVKEAAQKWNMTEEQVRNLCKVDKIPGASKISGKWQIPDDAQDPHTTKKEEPKQEKSSKSDWYIILGLGALGVALSLLGGWIVTEDHFIFGGIILLLGAGILTFLLSPLFPRIKDEYVFAGIFLVAVVLSFVIFGTSSSGRNNNRGGPSGEPWKDLGVSKSEYMEIYNKYKYGN